MSAFMDLLQAIEGRKLDKVTALVLGKPDLIQGSDDFNSTPLHLASKVGFLEAVSLFVKHGALVDALDNGGWTPLHEATAGGKIDVVRFLLKSRSSTQFCSKKGETPLILACRKGLTEIAKALIEAGADPFLSSPKGNSLIHEATVSANNDLISYLVSKGLSLNAQNDSGNTPLHVAVERRNLNSLQFLLSMGADPSKKNAKNLNPEELAREFQYYDLAAQLEKGIPKTSHIGGVCKGKDTPLVTNAFWGTLKTGYTILEFVMIWFFVSPFLFFFSAWLMHRFLFHFPINSDWLKVFQSGTVSLFVFYGTHKILHSLLRLDKDHISAFDTNQALNFQVLLYFVVCLFLFFYLDLFKTYSTHFTRQFFEDFFQVWLIFCLSVIAFQGLLRVLSK